MKTRHASLWIAACAAWVGVGCSTRTLRVGDVTIETQPPVELTHEGFAFPFSPDGRYFAEYREKSKGEFIVQVRDYATKSLKLSFSSHQDGPYPVFFDKTGANLVTVSNGPKKEMVAYSLTDGTRRVIARGMDPTYFGGTVSYNADQTIVTTGGKSETDILTEVGKGYRTTSQVRFDPRETPGSRRATPGPRSTRTELRRAKASHQGAWSQTRAMCGARCAWSPERRRSTTTAPRQTSRPCGSIAQRAARPSRRLCTPARI